MSLRSDHKALVFLGAVGVLGAGVRVVRAAGKESVPGVQTALEHQAGAADSAAAAQQKRGSRTKQRSARAERARVGPDQAPRVPMRALDRDGYVRGRLDLDVATAAQIDSLPGVSATMARRIAVDRARRGPFGNLAGLQRVSGAGMKFLQQVDTLVTFSGTFARVSPSDTTLKTRRKRPR